VPERNGSGCNHFQYSSPDAGASPTVMFKLWPTRMARGPFVCELCE
jgi:hypothetical protein